MISGIIKNPSDARLVTDAIKSIKMLRSNKAVWNKFEPFTQNAIDEVERLLEETIDIANISPQNIIFLQNLVDNYPDLDKNNGLVTNFQEHSFRITMDTREITPGSKVIYLVHHTSRFESTCVVKSQLQKIAEEVGYDNVIVIAMTRGTPSVSGDANSPIIIDNRQLKVVTLRFQNKEWLVDSNKDGIKEIEQFLRQ